MVLPAFLLAGAHVRVLACQLATGGGGVLERGGGAPGEAPWGRPGVPTHPPSPSPIRGHVSNRVTTPSATHVIA